MISSKGTMSRTLRFFAAYTVLLFGAVWATSVTSVAQSSLPVIKVQAAQQSTYSRLAFDVPANVNYRFTYNDRRVRLAIDGAFDVDFSALTSASLQQIGNPRSVQQNAQTIVTFDMVAGVSPRDFRSGSFVILDIYGGDQNARLPVAQENANSTPAPSASPGTQSGDPAQSQTTAQRPVTPVENTVNAAAVNGTAATDDAADAGGIGEQAEPIVELAQKSASEESLEAGDQQIVLEDGAPIDVKILDRNPSGSVLELSGISDAIADASKVIGVTVTEQDNGIAIRFSWPEEVALAVFKRGGSLWAIFDQPYSFDPQGLVDAGSIVTNRLTRVAQRPHLDATILRLKVLANLSAVVERDQNDWILYLKDTPAKPRFPLKPSRRDAGGQGQQVFIPASNIGRKIEFEDPDVGDQLVVLPMLLQGQGLATDYSYAAADLLESAQGVVISPQTDFVTVERFQDGIAIRTTGNDILSNAQLARAGEEAGDAGQFVRLIDFERWRRGPRWEYRKNKRFLFYELSLQQAEDRNKVRWKIARYFLAHGRAGEALGILELMLEDDPLLEDNTDYLAVRGVANFKQGRLVKAKRDLSSRELESEQDAELWHALVAEAQGDYDKALEFYRRGRDVMGTYDVDDRAAIQLAVIRSAIATSDLEFAQRELGLINSLDLNEKHLAEVIYQRARIGEQQGQYAESFAQYDDLSVSPQRWIAARARHSRIKYALKTNAIDARTAIDQMERLRFAWRGDDFEAKLLGELSQIYYDTGLYEDSMNTLYLATSYYPAYAKENRLNLRMRQIFRDLYENGKADEMSPVKAIALWRRFEALAPLGQVGDRMVRQLAERLVDVDLLTEAADLYTYQITTRLEGVARANIAARLAAIHILNDTPEKAMQILRATREPRLPADILRKRRHVEARALNELDKYEEAEVLIENDRSAGAERIRADVYWNNKDWPRLVSSIRKLLGTGWQRNAPLTEQQRFNLIRLTIGMTFVEDRAGLIEMRRRYRNQMSAGDFANAFDLLTNDQELTGGELGSIASQIASVSKLQTFMRDYKSDFTGR